MKSERKCPLDIYDVILECTEEESKRLCTRAHVSIAASFCTLLSKKKNEHVKDEFHGLHKI